MKLYILISILLLSLTVTVSAAVNITTIGGVVYQDDINNGIVGVLINVTCSHDGVISYGSTVSEVMGVYDVKFSEDDCAFGDDVNITASYGSLTGTNNGIIDWIADDQAVGSLELDIGSVDIPLVPEFGFYVGMLTILSAVGIFFFVRRD